MRHPPHIEVSTVRESRIAVQPASSIIPFLPIAVASVIHLAAIVLSLDDVREWTKALLMPALVIALIWAAPERRSPAIVLGAVALLLSWVGDVTLGIEFVIGLAFFLLAHVTYLALFVTTVAVRRVQWWAVAYAVWLVVLLAILGTHTGPLLIPVIAYGTVLCAMAAFASRCNRWIAWGGALFIVSDSILAIDKFLPDAGIPVPGLLIMVTYIGAQTLIVWGILQHEHARVAAARPPVLRAR